MAKKQWYDWPVNKELAAHMKMRKQQNINRGMTAAEKWFYENYLQNRSSYKWSFQARWGFRLFDFWCHTLGCAIEIDGSEHNSELDFQKDQKEWNRSRIITIRIHNFDEKDAEQCVEKLKSISSWNERRKEAKMKSIQGADA